MSTRRRCDVSNCGSRRIFDHSACGVSRDPYGEGWTRASLAAGYSGFRNMSEFGFVADDIEWFAEEWWGRPTDGLSEGHIRRGGLTLATLFLDNMILRAWHDLGFTGEPQISGPDLDALASRQNLRLRHATAVIAGGGREDGDELAFVGAFRIDNPETGIPADADEGFAVQNTIIIRPESLARAEGSLEADIEKLWSTTEYLDAAAAVRRGRIITRRQLLTFFREHRAGVVRVLPSDGHSTPQKVKRALLELLGRVHVNRRDGVYFELLSMGQAVGRSVDLQKLASAIRARERAEQRSAPVMRTFESPIGLPGFNHTLRLPEPAGAVDPDAELSERLIRLRSLDIPIYKTIRWRYVRALFENGSMPAIAPQLWDDPFEKLICETDVHAAGTSGAPRLLHTLKRVVYGQCWSQNSESDALWRIYSTVVKHPATNRNTAFDDEGLRVRQRRDICCGASGPAPLPRSGKACSSGGFVTRTPEMRLKPSLQSCSGSGSRTHMRQKRLGLLNRC
jgi:hypothetical protein